MVIQELLLIRVFIIFRRRERNRLGFQVVKLMPVAWDSLMNGFSFGLKEADKLGAFNLNNAVLSENSPS